MAPRHRWQLPAILLLSVAPLFACDSTTPNSAPTANAGPDQSAQVGETVQLNGTGADPDTNDNLTYSWTLMNRPSGSSATISGASSANASFVPDVGGQYIAQLTVSDGDLSAVDDCTITVNSPPVADAGSDQTANVGETVSLNGSGSSDPDGTGLTYSWSFQSRPTGSSATLSGATTATPSFTPDVGGEYVARLTVSDGSASDSDDVTIDVNGPPTANAGPDQAANVGEVVQLDGTGSTDPNGDALSYSWSFQTRPGGSQAALQNANTATPTFTPDVGGTYMVSLVVSDGSLSSALDLVIITVNTPPVADAGPDQQVGGGDLVQLDGTGSEDPDGVAALWSGTGIGGGPDTGADAATRALTYLWSFESVPNGSQAQLSNPTSATPSFTADVEGTYVVRLVVSDGMASSQPDYVTVTSSSQVRTQLFLRYENGNDFLSTQQAPSGYVTITLYNYGSGTSTSFESILGNGLDGTDYGAIMWLHAGTATGQTGTWTVTIIIDSGGVETPVATHTFTVPFDPQYYVRYAADFSGISGGVAGDKIKVRLTLNGVSQGRVRFGSSLLDSSVMVPGTVTVTPVTSPAGVSAEENPAVKVEVSRGSNIRYRGG